MEGLVFMTIAYKHDLMIVKTKIHIFIDYVLIHIPTKKLLVYTVNISIVHIILMSFIIL